MTPPAFWQGVKEFNQEQFYDCHDTLEALWMESSEPHKRFYQGILQIAVACYHLGNLNWRGAVILLGEGSKKLSEYQPIYEDIDVSQLFDESSQLLKALQQIEPETIGEFALRLKRASDLPQFDRNHRDNSFGCKLPKIVKIVDSPERSESFD
ncbi:MAG: DUF309 domain-containing protein [Xenococcaceae cyanobacterium]